VEFKMAVYVILAICAISKQELTEALFSVGKNTRKELYLPNKLRVFRISTLSLSLTGMLLKL